MLFRSAPAGGRRPRARARMRTWRRPLLRARRTRRSRRGPPSPGGECGARSRPGRSGALGDRTASPPDRLSCGRVGGWSWGGRPSGASVSALARLRGRVHKGSGPRRLWGGGAGVELSKQGAGWAGPSAAGTMSPAAQSWAGAYGSRGRPTCLGSGRWPRWAPGSPPTPGPH